MPDLLAFLPVRLETRDSVRQRVDADINAGRDPEDPDFTDTTVGGFYYDLTEVFVQEVVRLWDVATVEAVAVAFPQFAFGEFLDYHGVAAGITRKAAARASGTVTFTGTPNTAIFAGSQVAQPGVDALSDEVVYEVTAGGVISALGTVDVPVRALDEGAAGNAAAGAVTLISAPIEGVTAVTNALGLSGGAEVESDPAYQRRTLQVLDGAGGAGTVADYERWALEEPGVGFVTVQPLWNGAGTVRVVVTDARNRPLGAATIASLQLRLDPTTGQGKGLAPIGASVTAATPTPITVSVAAVVTFAEGFTLDGAGGTVPLRAELAARVAEYIDRLQVGEDVVKNHIAGQFFREQGVYNVNVTTPAADAVVGPLEVAVLGTVALT